MSPPQPRYLAILCLLWRQLTPEEQVAFLCEVLTNPVWRALYRRIATPDQEDPVCPSSP